MNRPASPPVSPPICRRRHCYQHHHYHHRRDTHLLYPSSDFADFPSILFPPPPRHLLEGLLLHVRGCHCRVIHPVVAGDQQPARPYAIRVPNHVLTYRANLRVHVLVPATHPTRLCTSTPIRTYTTTSPCCTRQLSPAQPRHDARRRPPRFNITSILCASVPCFPPCALLQQR